MAKKIRTRQDEVLDKQQRQIFETNYQYLVQSLQNAKLPITLSVDKLRIDLARNRIAMGAIRLQSGKTRVNLPISMQGGVIWVKGDKVYPLPETANRGTPGYYFEGKEKAAAYLLDAARAVANLVPD